MCQTEIMRNVMMLLICVSAFGQPQPPTDATRADRSDVIRTNVNVVIAPTTVRDRGGYFINGLQLQDFELYLSLVIAVQKSSNLNDIMPKIQRIGSMLNTLVAGQDGEVAVVAFDHRIQVMQDFTNETEKVSEAMKRIVPGSNNHRLVDVVMDSIRMLKNRPVDRRRVLLLISEKRDKGSEGRLREALTAGQFANVAIYSLDISTLVATLTAKPEIPRPQSIPTTAQHIPAGGALTPTTIDQNYNNGNYIPAFVDIFTAVKSIFVDDQLDVFTRFTGGKQYSFVSEKSLEKAVQGISEELHSQYLLSYTPNNQGDGGYHEIKVTVNRPNLEIRTRPGYWVAARPDQ